MKRFSGANVVRTGVERSRENRAESRLSIPGPADLPRRILDEIRSRVGDFRTAASGLGRSQMWLWRQVRGNKVVDHGKVLELLDHFAVPHRFYLERLLEQAPEYPPGWLISYFRQNLPSPAEGREFLASFRARLGPVMGLAEWRCESPPPALDSEAQDRAPRGAFEEVAMRSAALAAAAPPGRLLREPLVDAARACLGWSRDRLAAGNLAAAAEGLLVCEAILERAPHLGLSGEFLVAASDLLLGLDQATFALRLAREAVEKLQLPRSPCRAKALLQLGKVLRRLGRGTEARIAILAALRIGGAAPGERASSWFALAQIAGDQGRIRRAAGLLDRAERQLASRASLPAAFWWWKGAVLARLGHSPALAVAALSLAADGLRAERRYSESLLAGVELIEQVLSGPAGNAFEVARRLGPSAQELEPAVQDLWLDLAALLMRKEKGVALRKALAALRRLLEARTGDRPPSIQRGPRRA